MFALQMGLALRYDTIEAPHAEFEAMAAQFFSDGGTGLNVTVPFKERAFALAGGQLDENARLAEAVNTLSLRDGRLYGSNTRSEEHTSELQSLMRISYAVFCLKKKKPHIN